MRALRIAVPGLLLVFSAVAVAVGSGQGAESSAVRCAGSAATIVGSGGKDRLSGTARADVIVGRGGADTIRGRGGNDKICDGGGNDRVVAGAGNDVVKGGGGGDRIDGGAGRDKLTGGAGTDALKGGGGNDRVSGNAGNDALRGNGGADRLNGGGGRDNCLGGPGADTIQNCETGDVTPPAQGDQPPVAVADTRTVAEDASAEAVDVLANDTDADGGPRSIGSVTQPANGTVAITGGGSDLSYEPDANYCNSAGGTDNFSYALTPGSSSAQVAVTVTCANDKPVVTTSAGPRAYPEGSGARTIDPGLTIADVDSPSLSGASVQITANFDSGQDDLGFTDQLGITGTYDSGTGSLTLTGDAPVADYQTAVRSVTFDTSANSASPARTVTFEVTDADASPQTSDPATRDIEIGDPNDAPVIVTQDPAAAEYNENDPPIFVDDQVSVSDPDAITEASASITANFQAGEDILGWTDNDTGDGITLDPSSTAQTVLLTGTGSAAAYQAALRAVTYHNASDSFDGFFRTVTFSATDELGDTGSDTRNVNVNAADDPAVAEDDSATVTEDDPATDVPVLDNDTELDDEPLTINNVTQPAKGTVVLTGGSIGSHTGLTYEPDPDYCNDSPMIPADTFTYQLNSGDAATVSMTVTCVDDGPVAGDDAFGGNNSAHGNTTMVVNDPDDPASSPPRPKTTVSGDILANDTDAEDDALSVTPGTFATNDGGSVTIEADGDFTFEPAAATSCTDNSDFFDYTVGDGTFGGTDTGRVTIAIAGCVWYVSNSAAGNSGTSAAPFDTLAQAEAASGVGHTVFVFDGDNTTTGYDTGYAMASGERLIGEHEGLRVDQDGAGGGFTEDTLHPANPGARPTLTATGEDVVELDDANLVTGFVLDPAGSGGGIAGGAGDSGGGTIEDVRVTDTGTAGEQPGLELVGTSGTFNVSDLVVDNSVATAPPGTARGVLLSGAGTVNFIGASGITLNTKGATALDASNTNMGSGSVFDSITVTNTATGAVSLVNTTGTTQLGDGAGTDLSLATTSGHAAALRIESAGNVSVPAAGTANITATGGPAVQVTGTPTASLPLDDVDSTNSSSEGISIGDLGTGGSFSASSGDIAGAAGSAFRVVGGSGTISYPGNLNNGPGETAIIQSRTGGTVTLNGQVNDTNDPGGGINLAGNSGGSTTFSNASKTLNTGSGSAVGMFSSDGHTLNLTGGGLDIDTTSGAGLQALTSGTLVVTGSGNTLTTATGTPLAVQNTDIGASGLTFRSISSNGAVNGINLNNTGSAGGLAVTGTGSPASGGTILGSAGPGAALTNVLGGASLSHMQISGGGDDGISANNVAGGVDVIASSLSSNGNAVAENGLDWTDVRGVSTISGTTVTGSSEHNARISSNVGTHDIDIAGSTFSNNSTTLGSAGLLITGGGAATVNADVTSSVMQANRDAGFQLSTNAGGAGAMNLNFVNNDVLGGNPGAVSGQPGVLVSSGDGTDLRALVQGNDINGSRGSAIIAGPTPNSTTASAHDVTIQANTIGTSAAGSGSSQGIGVFLQGNGAATTRIALKDNLIQHWAQNALRISSGEKDTTNVSLNQPAAADFTVTGNTMQNGDLSKTDTISLIAGVQSAAAAQTVCADIGGAGVLANAFGGQRGAGAGDFDLQISERFAAALRFPGFSGDGTSQAAIQGYVQSRNTGSPTVGLIDNGIDGGDACAAPALPPSVTP